MQTPREVSTTTFTAELPLDAKVGSVNEGGKNAEQAMPFDNDDVDEGVGLMRMLLLMLSQAATKTAPSAHIT